MVLLGLLVAAPNTTFAQSTCNAYDETWDEMVNRLFTAPRHQDYRESEFPATLHSVMESEIRRLNLPDEQWICNEALEAIRGDEPVPQRERAIYRVKEYYFMVAFSYYTDELGNQRINEPAAGVLFDPQFNMIGLVMM
jgi:hypothetical protein